MPVSFNSPPRNFFLLGSGSEQGVTNFFHNINRSSLTDGQYSMSDIGYSGTDQKFILAGSGKDSNTVSFGFIEKQAYDAETDPANPTNVEDYRRKFNTTTPGTNCKLNFMRQQLKYGGLIYVGGTTNNIPWVSQLNSTGSIVWTATSTTANLEYFDVAITTNGTATEDQIYACGYTTTGDVVGYIEKWDGDGNPLWGKSATRIGGDVRLRAIAANDRDQVVAVGAIDGVEWQGYVVKVDAQTGEIVWDLTINSGEEYVAGSKNPIELRDVYIDDADQIYIVGSESTNDGSGVINNGIIFKYTAEGNLIWQKRTAVGEEQCYYKVWSDTAVEQTVVISHEVVPGSPTKRGPSLIKYSKNGDVVFKRRIQSSTNFADEPYGLEGDPSFYYILFVDEQENVGTGASKTYNFGKVSSSGNGFGEFTYDATNSKTITYSVNSAADRIGRLSDGSVRNDTSDQISYPYNGLKTLFDDYATNIAYKKTRHEVKDAFLYSGSPTFADPQPLLGANTNIPVSVSGSTATVTDTGHNLTTGMSVRIKLQLESPSIIIFNYSLTVSYIVTVVDANTFTYDLGNSTYTGYTGRAFYYEPDITYSGSVSSPVVRPVDFQELNLLANVYSGSGDWLDQSGKGNDCTPQSGVAYVGAAVSGDRGRYFDFDGSQDKIVGPDCSTIFEEGGSASIEVWVSFDDVTTRQTIVSGYISDPNRWDFEVKDGVIRGGHHDNTWFTSASSVTTGTWYHFIFVLNNSTNTLKFYLDGKEDASVASSGFDFHSGVPFSLGDRTNSSIGGLNGRISEVRVYNRALSVTQVFQNYNATQSKYKFDLTEIAARVSNEPVIDSTLILHYDFWNTASWQPQSNLIPWSTDEGNWSEGSAGKLVRNAGIAPDGTNSATKVSTTSTDIDLSPQFGPAYPSATGQILITGGRTYTLSVWAKASTPDQVGNDFKLRWKRVQGTNLFPVLTFQLEKNWKRYHVNATTFSDNSTIACYIGGVPGSEALVWGAQLEEGGSPRNYVPTFGNAMFGQRGPAGYRTQPKNLSSSFLDTNASDGAVTGTVWNDDDVPCFDFTASGLNTSFIDTGVNAGSVSAITVECWIKVDTYSNSGAGITIGDPSGSVTDQCYLGVGTSGGNSIDWRFYVDPYQQECEFFTSSTDWQHVVGVYDQDAGYGTMRLYINDVEQDTAINTTNTSPIDFSSYRNIMIGTNSNQSSIGGGDLDGKIAEVRVYKRRLLVGEISKNFNATRAKYGV